MGTRNKLFICIASFSAIAILLIYSSLSYRYGKPGAISRLQSAIGNKDAEAAVKLIKSSDKSLTFDEKSMGYFLDYISSSKKDLKELMGNLHKQAQSKDTGHNKKKDTLEFYITLKKSPHKFLFFDTYYFEMKPCLVNFKINYASTKLYVDGKYICTSDTDNFSNKIGPFIPGKHKVTTICETVFGRSENNESFNFVNPYWDGTSENYYICYTSVKGNFARIASNYEDAEVFINGKDSGKKSKDFTSIGPIDPGVKNTICFQREFPWGIAKSEDIDVRESSTLDVFINGKTDKLIDELKSTVAEFNNSLADALRAQKSSYIKAADENFVAAIDSVISNMHSENQFFNGRYLKSDLVPYTIWAGSDSPGSEYLGQYTALFECVDYYNTDYANKNVEAYILRTSKGGCRNLYTASYDEAHNKWKIVSIQFTGN